MQSLTTKFIFNDSFRRAVVDELSLEFMQDEKYMAFIVSEGSICFQYLKSVVQLSSLKML